MTIKDLLKKAGHRLQVSDIDHPRSDAELLLAHVLDKPREFLLTHPEKDVSKTHLDRFEKLLARRKTHEPIAYLLGYKEFYGRAFGVDKDVLIPRPETETLIEAVLEGVAALGASPEGVAILDIGTGSGCIALTLAAELPGARAIGLDDSENALSVASENARLLDLDGRTDFRVTDIASPKAMVPVLPAHETLVLTANLPYLPDFTWETRPSGIKDHEPVHAFVSGADGLNHYRALLRRLVDWRLEPDIMAFEADPPQFAPLANIVRGIFREHRLSIRKDLRGLDRVLLASRK